MLERFLSLEPDFADNMRATAALTLSASNWGGWGGCVGFCILVFFGSQSQWWNYIVLLTERNEGEGFWRLTAVLFTIWLPKFKVKKIATIWKVILPILSSFKLYTVYKKNISDDVLGGPSLCVINYLWLSKLSKFDKKWTLLYPWRRKVKFYRN
jgi:hypothetical protein